MQTSFGCAKVVKVKGCAWLYAHQSPDRPHSQRISNRGGCSITFSLRGQASSEKHTSPTTHNGERAQIAQTRVPAVRRCVWAGGRSEEACAHGARAAQRPRVPAVRRCVWGGEHSEDACAHGTRAAQRPRVPACMVVRGRCGQSMGEVKMAGTTACNVKCI